MIRFEDLEVGPGGLVPVVVQDVATNRVAMVAYMDDEAYEATTTTGYAHFHSRSRDALWKKGETSGNTLAVVDILADCDADTLLVRVAPSGPVCHTGDETCFGDSPAPTLGAVVDGLTDIVASRTTADTEVSYTARLTSDRDLAARKVLEEAGEVAFAVKDLPGGAPERVVEEAADLVYHLLALLAASEVDPGEVGRELRRRMG